MSEKIEVLKERIFLHKMVSYLALNTINPSTQQEIYDFILKNFESYQYSATKASSVIKSVPFKYNGVSYLIQSDFYKDEITNLFYKNWVIGDNNMNVIVNFLLNTNVSNQMKEKITSILKSNDKIRNYFLSNKKEKSILMENNEEEDITELNDVVFHLEILSSSKNIDKEKKQLIENKLEKLLKKLSSIEIYSNGLSSGFNVVNKMFDDLINIISKIKDIKINFSENDVKNFLNIKNKKNFYIKDSKIINDKINLILLKLKCDIPLEDFVVNYSSLYINHKDYKDEKIKEKVQIKIKKDFLKNKSLLNTFTDKQNICVDFNYVHLPVKDFNNIDNSILSNYFNILKDENREVLKPFKDEINPVLKSLVSNYKDESSEEDYNNFKKFFNYKIEKNAIKYDKGFMSLENQLLLDNNFVNLILANINLINKIYKNDINLLNNIFKIKERYFKNVVLKNSYSGNEYFNEYINEIPMFKVFEKSLNMYSYSKKELDLCGDDFKRYFYNKIIDLYSSKYFMNYSKSYNYRNVFFNIIKKDTFFFNNVLENKTINNDFFPILGKVSNVFLIEGKIEEMEIKSKEMKNYLKKENNISL